MTVMKTDRWWPVTTSDSLFPTPPFPGSHAPMTLPASSTVRASLADEPIRCVAAMRRHLVGGTFWATRPALEGAPFILARPRDANQFHDMAEVARVQELPVTFWFPDKQAAKISHATSHTSIIGQHDPWHLLASAKEVWVDRDDVFALFAAIAAPPQRLFGGGHPSPLIADHAFDPAARLANIFGVTQFQDPFSGEEVAPSILVETLGFWRELIDDNRPVDGIYGIAFWKRPSIAPLMWNGSNVARFRTVPPKSGRTAAAAAWVARTPAAVLNRLRSDRTSLFQIEDGFIRSIGLGADCVPPLSIVVDSQGAHYDPAQASGLETLLANHDFTAEMLGRARRLRTLIVEQGISKYGIGAQSTARKGGNRKHVLVTGQVEDDQSVLKGGGGLTSNLELLRRVRATEPTAFIIYRPHPDVDAGHRKGYIEDDVVLAVADSIAREDAITSLIDAADNVHVLTSLAGFEALMRGKPVTTHGVPFYAGWGLTEDLGAVPTRRGRQRSLDELVAAALLLYPRYLDPVTGLPCPPEVLVDRIASGYTRQSDPLVFARRMLGRLSGLVRDLTPRRAIMRQA
jgi:capsular polysaccharide export protein